jgi:hypothetical protein
MEVTKWLKPLVVGWLLVTFRVRRHGVLSESRMR